MERYVKELEKSKEAKDYLKSRGFSEEDIAKFGFGYVPKRSSISIEVAEGMNIIPEELVRYGIALKRVIDLLTDSKEESLFQ